MATLPECWKCGAPLEDAAVPIHRLAECPVCHAELHVCRACVFYDTAKAKYCREPIAEEVQDKQRANFCDYFQLRPDAGPARDETAARAARSQLEALFGRTPAPAAADSPAETEADCARAALEALFKPRGGD